MSLAAVPAPLNAETLARAPKVLLHDHLDGGCGRNRARARRRARLSPAAGVRSGRLGRWFRQAADSGSLVRYLETFAHTVGVMQRPEAIHRVARECALDLAADGVVYAEVRFAPELSTAQGLPIEAVVEAMVAGFAAGSAEATAAGNPITVGAAAVRDAAGRPLGGGGGSRRPLPGRGRGRLRPGRSRGRVPARPRARGDRPAGPRAGAPHDPRREAFGVESIRAALDGAHAERIGHGVRIADEVHADGTLGPAGAAGP